MARKPNIQKTITVVGRNYIDFVIWDLLAKAFDAYQKLDFSKRRFQTSIWEHSHATAAIVLTAIGIESYRNWLCYVAKVKVTKKTVVNDLCTVLAKRDKTFPADRFKELLTEVFVLRNVIAHNHLYEVRVYSDENWAMLSHRQRLLEGYGDNREFRQCVNSRTRRTKLLKFNVQPAKVGFEDLFKVLVILDLMVGVTRSLVGVSLLQLHYEIDGYDFRNLSEVLTHYFDGRPNRRFTTEVEKLSATLRRDFKAFLPPDIGSEWFITNTCPRCSTLGFSKRPGLISCSKCGFRISVASGAVLPE